MKKFSKTILGILSILVAIFLISYPIILSNLIVDEEPVTTDVIIVPEGGSQRSEKAAELYNEGYSESDKIIVSPLTKENKKDYEKIPKKDILAETEATSTYTNATNTLALMEENNYDSALIVTTDYHTLRTKLSYERVNEAYDYDLTIVAAYPESGGEERPWYDYTPESFKTASREFIKIWGYWFGLYKFIDL